MRGCRCKRAPLLLAWSTRGAAKLVRASRENGGRANVQCNWLRQILQVWLVNDRRVEDVKGVFVLGIVHGVVFTAITGGDFDLQ